VLKKAGVSHLASSIAATFVRSDNSVTCVTFFSDSLEPIFIASRPFGRAVLKRKIDAAQDFVFWPKKSLTNKKISSVNVLEAIFLPLKLSK